MQNEYFNSSKISERFELVIQTAVGNFSLFGESHALREMKRNKHELCVITFTDG